jgi:hypothetical protein
MDARPIDARGKKHLLSEAETSRSNRGFPAPEPRFIVHFETATGRKSRAVSAQGLAETRALANN